MISRAAGALTGRLPLQTRNRREVVAVVVLLVGLLLYGQVSSIAITTAAFTVTFILLGQSFNIISGMAGPLAVGQSAFFGLTAFSTLWLANKGVNQYLEILVGVVASVVLAAIVGLVTLRLAGFFFAIAA